MPMLMTMDVAPDQLRSRTLLETQATYRVLSVHRRHAVVQVVDVPGLAPGLRFRLALKDVEQMDVVDVRAEVESGLAELLMPGRPDISQRAA
jgi:hypothetical protein